CYYVQIGTPPTTQLFPYTTLFRSRERDARTPQAPAQRLGRRSVHASRPVEHQAVEVACRRGRDVALAHVLGHALRLPLERIAVRSEEHTSELQSRENLVCRLLLEK